MPAHRVVHILIQACGSLAEAHRANLIHRDIKPANIYLCERGGVSDTVKVLDFGLVKMTSTNTPGSLAVTSDNLISGTPSYMAPEIIRQADHIDGRSDLYSLACVAFFLLTGRVVFDGDSVMGTLMLHMNEAPTRPS